MKTNKDDIRALKSKHRLELVMQEAGESFEVDAAKPDQWHSKKTPSLIVDIRRQVYEIKKPGTDIESGDVFTWLQRRYAWTFGMAIKFLQKRAPDPKQKTEPVKTQIKSQIIRDDEDEAKPLDKWQERALQIGGEKMRKYFSKSWWDIATTMQYEDHRFMPIIALDVDECVSCGEEFNWREESITAYLCDRYDYPDTEIPEDDSNIFFLSAVTGVICEKCMQKKKNFYRALDYCRRSAERREEAEDQERRKRDREIWIMGERERERDEAALPP